MDDVILVSLRQEECGGWSSTGVAWRAYRADGTPLYLGGETREACEQRVRDSLAPRTVAFTVSP